MKIRMGYSEIVHNATKIRDEGTEEVYRLSCGGEAYVGLYKARITDLKVTCKECLRVEEK